MKRTLAVVTLLALMMAGLTVPSYAASEPVTQLILDGKSKAALDLLEQDPSLVTEKYADEGMTPLHAAAIKGDVVIARFLIEHGGAVNAVTSTGMTPLHTTARYGQKEVALLLLEHGANVDARSSDGITPLHRAASYGQDAMVELLIERGAGINVKSTEGKTPRYMALSNKYDKTAEILASRGAAPDILSIAWTADRKGFDELLKTDPGLMAARQGQGPTPLVIAMERGHYDLAAYMLERATKINVDGALNVAINGDRAELVKLLVKKGAQVNDDENPPLCKAAWRGNMVIATLLLDSGADVNGNLPAGKIPLLLSVDSRNPKMVELLLARGATINASDEEGRTALFKAAFNVGSELHPTSGEILKILLSHGARHTLLTAAAAGDNETVAALLDKNPDLIKACGISGDSPLGMAIFCGNKSTVALLLERGARADIKDKHGATILGFLLLGFKTENSAEIAELLIRKGAEVNARDEEGRTILSFVVQNGQQDLIKPLKSAGAQAFEIEESVSLGDLEKVRTYVKDHPEALTTPRKDKDLLLNYALRFGQNEVALFLLEKGAPVNPERLPDRYSTYPLYNAVLAGDRKMAEYLISHGADVNYMEVSGNPLMTAVDAGNPEIVKLLLDKGANPSVQYGGSTPLRRAVSHDSKEIAALLIDRGADPNMTIENISTPLQIAAWNGNVAMVKFLLDHGARPALRDTRGKTALDIAVNRGNDEVKKILEAAGK